MPWIWGIIIILTLLIELFTPDIDAIWFSVGALISLILAIFDVHVAIQLSTFVSVTALLLFTIGRWIKKFIMSKNIPINSDSLIGKKILILESITEFKNGTGVIDNIIWNVSCQAGVTIEKGAYATILAIDENKLVVGIVE